MKVGLKGYFTVRKSRLQNPANKWRPRTSPSVGPARDNANANSFYSELTWTSVQAKRRALLLRERTNANGSPGVCAWSLILKRVECPRLFGICAGGSLPTFLPSCSASVVRRRVIVHLWQRPLRRKRSKKRERKKERKKGEREEEESRIVNKQKGAGVRCSHGSIVAPIRVWRPLRDALRRGRSLSARFPLSANEATY